MTYPRMAGVIRLRIDAVDRPHPRRERGFESFDEQVIVVGHQAVLAGLHMRRNFLQSGVAI